MIRKLILFLIIIGFIIGAYLFVYPYFNCWQVSSEAKKSINEFAEQKEEHADIRNDELFKMMTNYNEKLFQEGQNTINDVWTFEQNEFIIGDTDYKNDIVATIKIPKMNLEMPIYLGASTRNMSKGITLLANTSLPIGGTNTNCVLAGHRGYRGIPFFRDIENLQIGDVVTIENYWEELKYIVSDIEIILPSETEKILIQEGKDVLTLVTCHPYRHNYQRYVVYCIRDSQFNIDIEKDELVSKEIVSSKNEIMFDKYLPIVLLVCFGVFLVILIKTNK